MKLSTFGFLLAAASQAFYGASALTPTGSYAGSKTIAGQTVQCNVNVIDENTMDLSIGGIISLTCPEEAYHMTGDSIFVDGASTAGNCVHDALADNKVTLKSIVFTESSDQIVVSVKYSVMNIDIILTKGGLVLPMVTLAATPTGRKSKPAHKRPHLRLKNANQPSLPRSPPPPPQTTPVPRPSSARP